MDFETELKRFSFTKNAYIAVPKQAESLVKQFCLRIQSVDDNKQFRLMSIEEKYNRLRIHWHYGDNSTVETPKDEEIFNKIFQIVKLFEKMPFNSQY